MVPNAYSPPHSILCCAPCTTPARALLLLGPRSLLESSEIFCADKMALFRQIVSNKTSNLKGRTCHGGQMCKLCNSALSLQIWMARANCGYSLPASADFHATSRTLKASLSDRHSTRKCGWYSVFSSSSSAHGIEMCVCAARFVLQTRLVSEQHFWILQVVKIVHGRLFVYCCETV